MTTQKQRHGWLRLGLGNSALIRVREKVMQSAVQLVAQGQVCASVSTGLSKMTRRLSPRTCILLRARRAPLRSQQSTKAASRSCFTAMKASRFAASTYADI